MSASEQTKSQQQEQSSCEDLCPNCMTANQATAHFCSQCNAPLSAHAATDPLGRIAAVGHVYRKASSRPHSRLVLIGMWLLIAPLFITNLPALWFSFRMVIAPLYRIGNVPASYDNWLASLGFFLISLGGEAIFVLILVKVTQNYRSDD